MPSGAHSGWKIDSWGPPAITSGGDRSVLAKLADPQLRAVPWHVGVVPLQPGQPLAVGAEARIGVEVGTRGEDHAAARRRSGRARQWY